MQSCEKIAKLFLTIDPLGESPTEAMSDPDATTPVPLAAETVSPLFLLVLTLQYPRHPVGQLVWVGRREKLLGYLAELSDLDLQSVPVLQAGNALQVHGT